MKSIIKYLSFVICAFAFASCAIVRGYRADGLYGPNIFSFEHCEHDTIANGDKVFHFPVAERPVWIDTLHFYTQQPHYKNITLPEALNTKSKTQPNGAFYVTGTTEREFIEIESDTPVLREDMVTIGMGTADLRYRGEFRNWSAKIRIEYIKDGVFTLENIINMINLGGFCCGLGEWRTEKGGLSGSFHVETIN